MIVEKIRLYINSLILELSNEIKKSVESIFTLFAHAQYSLVTLSGVLLKLENLFQVEIAFYFKCQRAFP